MKIDDERFQCVVKWDKAKVLLKKDDIDSLKNSIKSLGDEALGFVATGSFDKAQDLQNQAEKISESLKEINYMYNEAISIQSVSKIAYDYHINVKNFTAAGEWKVISDCSERIVVRPPPVEGTSKRASSGALSAIDLTKDT